MCSKELKWIGSTKERLKEFPDLARREAGEQLWRLQTGREPEHWRSMPSVGVGAAEVKIRRPHQHRVIYVAKFSEAVYVLHAFEKKSQKTANKDIEIARNNYATMEKERKK